MLKVCNFINLQQPPRSVEDQPPGSPVMNVLTPEQLAVIDALNQQLAQEHRSKEAAALQLAIMLNEQRLRKARFEEIKRNHELYQDRMRRTNVHAVYGPQLPPAHADLFGLKVTPTMFQLDLFLESEEHSHRSAPIAATGPGSPQRSRKIDTSTLPSFNGGMHDGRGYRAKVQRILERLDYSGVVANYFLKDPSTLHLLVPTSFTQPCRVFRDFAFCTKRPSANTFWQGNHVLHIKTNITKHSDIKYRFLLEGYNFGVNAPVNSVVVGYAARRLDHLDQLESYGWPDSWDENTIQSGAKGIQSIKQYFSADDFVVLRCEAKSFSCVGFSVSAWLVCHDFGHGFVPHCDIVHQADPL